jgi:hypothetical protein
MPKIDVTDEAVIDAKPSVVFNALLDEYSEVTHWWMPYLESKLRGDMPIREGAIVDITINPKSRTKSKISEKWTKIVETRSIEVEIAGAFVGSGKWTFEPTDGKTKVQYRFNARTNRLLFSLVSPFVNIGKAHSDTMQKGFKALNSYLSKK